MAADFDQRVASIEAKARLLTERYAAMAADRRHLAERVGELEAQLLEARKSIEALQAKIDYLRLATTILPSGEDIDHGRQFLSDLVWEIDRCISQLSE